MPGLPCDVCQEDSSYVLNGEDLDDANGVTFYRRYRVCTNPKCERFLHRRVSVEYYPEDQGKTKVYQPTEVKKILRALGERLPEALANDDNSQPLLWEVPP